MVKSLVGKAGGIGSGRPMGHVAPPSRSAVNALLCDNGLLPIEVLVGSMRWFHQESLEAWKEAQKEEDINLKTALLSRSLMLRRDAIFCAKESAPYMHPRLASISLDSKDANTPVVLQIDAVDSGL